jgi:hypothetical protein
MYKADYARNPKTKAEEKNNDTEKHKPPPPQKNISPASNVPNAASEKFFWGG